MEVVYILGLVLMGLALLDAVAGVAVSIRQSFARAKYQQRQSNRLRTALVEKSPESSGESGGRWKGFRRFSVVNKVMEAEDICSFYLGPVDGNSVCPFEPGQHIGFRFTVPGDSKPTIRSYSLSSGELEDNLYRVTIKKVPPPPDTDFPPGKGSSFFHEELEIGSVVEVSAPNGKFFLDREDDRPAVLIAGGIGITPLLSILETICKEGLERTCHLFHAVRSHRDHAFAERLQELVQVRDHLHLHTYFSHPEEGQELPADSKTGFLSVDAIREAVGHLEAQFYICGPPPMMQAMVPSMEEAGIRTHDIKMEAFGPASIKKKKSSNEEKASAIEASTPLISFANKAVKWDGESSILEMAEENEVEIDSSCRSGSCGTCQVRLLSGKVKYDDEPACEPDDGNCLTCVGVPDGDIELDV